MAFRRRIRHSSRFSRGRIRRRFGMAGRRRARRRLRIGFRM